MFWVSNVLLFTTNGEIAAVCEEAPEPLQRTEQETTKPQTAQVCLEHKDSEGRQDDEDQAERGTKAEANAIEQYDADERLADIVREGHTPCEGHHGEELITGGRMLIGHTKT